MCTSDGHVAAIVIVEALVVAAVSVVSTWSFMKRRYETANTNESVYSLPPDAIYPVSPTIGSFQSQGAGVTPSPNSEVYNMFPPPTIIVNNETRTNQEEFKRQVNDICISPVNERENSSAQSHAATEQPDEGIYESYDVHGPAAKPTSSPKDFNPSTLKQAIKNLKAKETADTRKYGSYEQYNQPPAKRPSIKPRPKKPNVPAPLPPPQIPSDAEVGDYEPTASETWEEPAEEETDYEFSFPPLPIK
uniref:Uncharacterized protein n=2 Tax=Ciona intestinalis TaxID=7719 RepID=F6TC17_CIOIN